MIVNANTTLPQVTKGMQTKWKIGNIYYKADMLGYESLFEVLVSELEYFIKDFKYIDYQFATRSKRY